MEFQAITIQLVPFNYGNTIPPTLSPLRVRIFVTISSSLLPFSIGAVEY